MERRAFLNLTVGAVGAAAVAPGIALVTGCGGGGGGTPELVLPTPVNAFWNGENGYQGTRAARNLPTSGEEIWKVFTNRAGLAPVTLREDRAGHLYQAFLNKSYVVPIQVFDKATGNLVREIPNVSTVDRTRLDVTPVLEDMAIGLDNDLYVAYSDLYEEEDSDNIDTSHLVRIAQDTGEVRWRIPTAQRGDGSSRIYAMADGTLRYSALTGVYSFNSETGERIWEFPTNSARYSRASHSLLAAEADGACYIYETSTDRAELFCLNADGSLRWRKRIAENYYDVWLRPLAVGANGLLFLIENDRVAQGNFIRALDPATGEERWRTTAQPRADWSRPNVALGGNNVFIGMTVLDEKLGSARSRAYLTVLNANTGQVRARHQVSEGLATGIHTVVSSYDGSTVCISAYSSNNSTDPFEDRRHIIMMSTRTGEILWRRDEDGDKGINPMLAGNDGVLYGHHGTGLLAIR